MRLEQPCTGVALVLTPRALIDDVWMEPSALTKLGTLSVQLQDELAYVRFDASADVQLQGLELTGTVDLPGARGWLSNGFQSWSASGVIELGAPPTEAALNAALIARGDSEVIRTGTELSWFLTYTGGGETQLVAGATTANRLKPWAQISRPQPGTDTLQIRLASGGTGDRIALSPGGSAQSETWFLDLGPELHPMLESYAQAMPTRRDTVTHRAEAGWNSWYELWDTVSAADVRANAALAKTILEPRLDAEDLPLRIVVDDGWQQAWGEWLPNDKFPEGLDGLATDLSADGFLMGVWLAPLLVSAESTLVADHPEWFVQGASYVHGKNGEMRILDPTHPEAAAHLTSVIQQIVGWGYDLLKIDFLFAGTFEGTRFEDVTGLEAYHRALEIIRNAAPNAIILAVGAPGPPSFPHVDAWRVGPDIALEAMDARWPAIPEQARTLAARWMWCQHVTLCDADPPLLRVLERNEVEAGVWVAALGGGALFLSDDLQVLPEERRTWGLEPPALNAALSEAGAVPLDLIPETPGRTLANYYTDLISRRSTHVLPRLWRLPSGRRVAFNSGSSPITVEGLEIPGRSVVMLSE